MRKSRSKTDIDQVDGLEIFRRRRHRSDTPDGNASQASSEISNNGRKRNGSGPFSWQRNSGKHSAVSHFLNDFDVVIYYIQFFAQINETIAEMPLAGGLVGL